MKLNLFIRLVGMWLVVGRAHHDVEEVPTLTRADELEDSETSHFYYRIRRTGGENSEMPLAQFH